MKNLTMLVSLVACTLLIGNASLAQKSTQLPPVLGQQIVVAYAQLVSETYANALKAGRDLEKALQEFIKKPNEATHTAAKNAWIAARTAYSPTEIYRFYGGPIDDDDGPEGSLNAWPLDEVYIDYVVGSPNSGIINDLANFPQITAELLKGLNEKEGEKNISTGFHAIEFLLWGQDLSLNGPGKRKYTDYVKGQGKNAERRGQYMTVVARILVEDLESLVKDWDQNNPESYGSQFIKPENTQQSLTNLLKAVYSMSAEELSQERMFVAYDTQQQEEEHSCFSDTTHMDIYDNFVGIRNVLNLVLPTVNSKNPMLAQKVSAALDTLEQKIKAMPKPFDQAIVNEQQRPQILEIIRALETLGADTLDVANSLGITLK